MRQWQLRKDNGEERKDVLFIGLIVNTDRTGGRAQKGMGDTFGQPEH